MSPWLFTLFVGVLDFGFYGYAAINIQNAARVAALRTSASSALAANNNVACTYALAEMSSLANLSGVTTCSALPLIVTATSLSGAGPPTAPLPREWPLLIRLRNCFHYPA